MLRIKNLIHNFLIFKQPLKKYFINKIFMNKENLDKKNTIFHKILNKEIPSTCIYEDDKVYAFNDINPQAPIHVILIPKEMNGLDMLENAKEEHKEILGYMLFSVKKIAEKLNLKNGYRIVINDNIEGCQEVPYFHLHILGGRQLGWPPGTN